MAKALVKRSRHRPAPLSERIVEWFQILGESEPGGAQSEAARQTGVSPRYISETMEQKYANITADKLDEIANYMGWTVPELVAEIYRATDGKRPAKRLPKFHIPEWVAQETLELVQGLKYPSPHPMQLGRLNMKYIEKQDQIRPKSASMLLLCNRILATVLGSHPTEEATAETIQLLLTDFHNQTPDTREKLAKLRKEFKRERTRLFLGQGG